MGNTKTKPFNYVEYINTLSNKLLKCNIISIDENITVIIHYKNNELITPINLYKCYKNKKRLDEYNLFLLNKSKNNLYIKILKNSNNKLDVYLYDNEKEYKQNNSINDQLINSNLAYQNKYYERPKTPIKIKLKSELGIREKMFIELKEKVQRRNTYH